MVSSMTEGEIHTTESKETKKTEFKTEIVWKNVILFIILHFIGIVAILIMPYIKLGTVFLYIVFVLTTGLGVTAGAHRLWTHKSYKASLPLQLFLLFGFTMSTQNDAIEWCRDHRVHHKFSDTDGDPHNSKRGFFFSHMGWLMCKKHPDVKTKGKTVDISDLENHPLLKFQRKYFIPLALVCTVALPTALPVFMFKESVLYAFLSCVVLRIIFILHMTWLVNSAAHMWGYRPYDKTIQPRENAFVKFFALGEGFHNYHHAFPWDYSTGELGLKPNFTTGFIDLMAYFGHAYDFKTTDSNLIKARAQRTGQ